jgi:hypothetical protein
MEFNDMSAATLHTGFNKLIVASPIQKGIVNSVVQFSLVIPSIDTIIQDDISYTRGELFQKGFDLFKNFVDSRGKSAYFTYYFTKMARDLALKQDICVYCFMLPDAKTHLSYAIATQYGCQYIETTGKNAKQISINQYIVDTLNQTGWF